MAGELVPEPGMLASDAERNQTVEVLSTAVGEGRLTLAEFEERIGAAHAARTNAELARLTADLPVVAAPAAVTLRSRASRLRRNGRWAVPRQVTVEVRAANVRLDLTDAVITSPTVEMLLDAHASSLTVVLPPGGSASIEDVELSASSARATVPETGGVHVVLRGHLHASNLRVRYQRRFLRWRW